jgi:hypothetical protein
MMNANQPIQTQPKGTQQRLLHQRQTERNIESEHLRKLAARLQVKIRQQQEETRLARAT